MVDSIELDEYVLLNLWGFDVGRLKSYRIDEELLLGWGE
jgi:hypothetical protein